LFDRKESFAFTRLAWLLLFLNAMLPPVAVIVRNISERLNKAQHPFEVLNLERMLLLAH
jgi:hypothetical protein